MEIQMVHEAMGEQKLEFLEARSRFLKICTQYTKETAIGAMLELCAAAFIMTEGDKAFFLNSCKEVFEVVEKKHFDFLKGKEEENDSRK